MKISKKSGFLLSMILTILVVMLTESFSTNSFSSTRTLGTGENRPSDLSNKKIYENRFVGELTIKLQHQFKTDNLTSYDVSELYHRTGHYPVPNVLHFIRFGPKNMTFVEMICVKAAYINAKPDILYIHTDQNKIGGEWWQQISHLSRIKIVYRRKPKRIFGKKINVIQHASDVARLEVLMEYGGTYLDNDAYVVQSLDMFRKYDFAVAWPAPRAKTNLGNQVLISSSTAPFLYLYYDTYRQFDDSRWYYNAGVLPTYTYLRVNPKLVHTAWDEELSMVVRNIHNIYVSKSWNWRKRYTIHLLYNHRYYLTKSNYKKYPSHDDLNIRTLESPFGEMMREIYDAEAN